MGLWWDSQIHVQSPDTDLRESQKCLLGRSSESQSVRSVSKFSFKKLFYPRTVYKLHLYLQGADRAGIRGDGVKPAAPPAGPAGALSTPPAPTAGQPGNVTEALDRQQLISNLEGQLNQLKKDMEVHVDMQYRIQALGTACIGDHKRPVPFNRAPVVQIG